MWLVMIEMGKVWDAESWHVTAESAEAASSRLARIGIKAQVCYISEEAWDQRP